jgi:hypothetical protein
MMKYFLFIVLWMLGMSTIEAQKLSGVWYSEDSTRVYAIKQTADDTYMAVIKSTARKADSVGYVVIRDLHYNIRKKRYEGVIYAVTDGQPAFVKIKFLKDNANRISLKLSRMFILDVSIIWKRVST